MYSGEGEHKQENGAEDPEQTPAEHGARLGGSIAPPCDQDLT